MSEQGKLTPKQQKFADEYLIDLNATGAYRRAGYTGTGNTATVNASRLLANANISSYIANRQLILQEKTGITQERVLAEYAKLAFLDPRKFYDDHGNLIPIHKLPADVAAALSGMDVSEVKGSEGESVVDYVKKIKMIDKKGALDSIAKILGMFVEKSEQKITGEVTITKIERIVIDADRGRGNQDTDS